MKNSKTFRQRVKNGDMVLSLVGMSNSGKSTISSRLVDEFGFKHVCADDLIEQELGHLLEEYGYSGIEDMAKWMGMPYEKQSPENQKIYLEREKKIMRKIINNLRDRKGKGNIVIDTTGSVVHTGAEICSELSELSTVVCFEVSDNAKSKMFKNFIEIPKPIVWGNLFSQNDGESPEEALARCYPMLLDHRGELYVDMAHVVLPRDTLIDISGEDFLNRVVAKLSV